MNSIKSIVTAAAAVLILGSCIKDTPDDCRVKVGFQYTYNMLSANALDQQVDELMLYIFDESGTLVQKHTRQGDAISNDMSVAIDGLDAGRYSFVAWGRSNSVPEEDAYFDIPDMTVGQSRIEELQYRLRTDNGERSGELNNFLVGVETADIRNTSGQSVTVGLRKVTNKIRVIIMPYSSGSSIGADDYSLRIEDPVGSGIVNHDFSILSGTPITYRPYYSAILTPSDGESPGAGEVDRALVAELATSRLIQTNVPRLKITYNVTGNEAANIDLAWLFSLMEMKNSSWSLQEFLDRQDEFVITLFFQNGSWMNATIIINGWVINNLDFGR